MQFDERPLYNPRDFGDRKVKVHKFWWVDLGKEGFLFPLPKKSVRDSDKLLGRAPGRQAVPM